MTKRKALVEEEVADGKVGRWWLVVGGSVACFFPPSFFLFFPFLLSLLPCSVGTY